jgi:hypothetical protein
MNDVENLPALLGLIAVCGLLMFLVFGGFFMRNDYDHGGGRYDERGRLIEDADGNTITYEDDK